MIRAMSEARSSKYTAWRDAAGRCCPENIERDEELPVATLSASVCASESSDALLVPAGAM